MNEYIIYSIGFLAQFLFSFRIIVQWFSSEKQKKVVAPSLFWMLSLIASLLLFIYGFLRNDFPIMLGQIITYYIYIRNLQLQNKWNQLNQIIKWFFIITPVFIIPYFLLNKSIDIQILFNKENISSSLLILGIISQLLFTLRFVFQWIISEKNKSSILPKGFWWISILGSLLILLYAIFRKDPVLFIGHVFGLTIYIRNLIIIKKY